MQPYIFSLSTEVTGNKQKLTLREALRYFDQVNGIRATNFSV